MNVIGTTLIFIGLLAGTALAIHRKFRFIGIVTLAGLVSLASFYIWQSYNWDAAFENLNIGSTEQSVIAVIGLPSRITDYSESVIQGCKKTNSELIADCSKEYWYMYFLFPQQLSFSFNAQNRLIHKEKYVCY